MKLLNLLFLFVITFSLSGQNHTAHQAERQHRAILGQMSALPSQGGGGPEQDTVNLNITAFGAHDCSESIGPRYANNIDMQTVTSQAAPYQMYAELFSVDGATVGPLTRTSATWASNGAVNNGTYAYDSLCDLASERLIRFASSDSMTYEIAGFTANTEYEVRIWGGGPFSNYGEFDVRVGDSTATSTQMYQQTQMESFYGDTDESGVLVISLKNPTVTYGYSKIIQIIGPTP